MTVLLSIPFCSTLRADKMNFAIGPPSTSFTFSSSLAISPSTPSSSCVPPSSCFLRHSLSTVSCSEGFVGISPVHQLTENAEKNKRIRRRVTCFDQLRKVECVRSTGSGILRNTSFKCASLGHAGDEEPGMSNVAAASSAKGPENEDAVLVSGSPIVIVEAPIMLKTAEPMPMMRPNRGQIKPGDAGRVIDKRPKDLWAVRFAVGAYLVERKCFKPLDIQ